jgi:transposase-like protein
LGQLLHGSARTTAAVRRAIQHSQESLAKLARRYDLNPKTVAKWKKRTQVDDAPMGPKQPCSTVLTVEEEALIVAFRKHTLLPLDDCLYALQATRPHLTGCVRTDAITERPMCRTTSRGVTLSRLGPSVWRNAPGGWLVSA